MTSTPYPKVLHPPPDGKQMSRVLVVDDEAPIRRFVGNALAREDIAIDEAGSVDEALAILSRRVYDVALVDLEMPRRSGLELLSALAQQGSQVVSVLLTGTTNVATAVAAMKHGAFDYIAKPASPDALRWAVSRAVSVAHARRREKSLEQVAGQWAATFDACPDMLLILDADGQVLRANEAVLRRTGAGLEELVGRPAITLFPGGLGAAISRGAAAVRADRSSAPATTYDVALAAHFLTSVSPILPTHSMVVVARDVSELVRSEAVRSRLLRELRTAQEDERGRIARELHDGIGQALVSLKVGLSMPADAPGATDRHDRLWQVAAETLEEVRRMAQSLRPTVLDDMGLEAALTRLTESFTDIHGVRAELVVPGSEIGRLPTEIESAVYRIIQEALANVAKHAQAQTADIIVEVADGSVHISVADDGSGFVPVVDGAYTGLGLTDIRERATMLGGTFQIESVSGRGTTINVRIPTLRRPFP